ncbi:MAG: hypothetical protein IIC18_07370 [Bacteroidetes bacterium]|nr:hypothetical protein [Bacteroidota bacterium]
MKELLEKTDDILQFTRPQALPMVIPPLDWSTELNGGYHYGLRGKYGLVRKSTGMRARRADMPFVYEGLNTIQAVAWKIHSKILRVVLNLRSTGSSLGGLPNPEPNPAPERPNWMLQKLPKNGYSKEQLDEECIAVLCGFCTACMLWLSNTPLCGGEALGLGAGYLGRNAGF